MLLKLLFTHLDYIQAWKFIWYYIAPRRKYSKLKYLIINIFLIALWKAQIWISGLKSKSDSILPINDTNAPCKRILQPHLEKFHKRSARSADNELWWRAPSVINIVSMHRSIITIRSNTRRPRAMPDASGVSFPIITPKGLPTTPEQHLRVYYLHTSLPEIARPRARHFARPTLSSPIP